MASNIVAMVDNHKFMTYWLLAIITSDTYSFEHSVCITATSEDHVGPVMSWHLEGLRITDLADLESYSQFIDNYIYHHRKVIQVRTFEIIEGFRYSEAILADSGHSHLASADCIQLYATLSDT